MSNIKVAILGCGYSGMICALSLAQQGISVTIIEKTSIESATFFDDPRTLAITATSKRFIEEIGVWNRIKHLCAPINEIYVVDNKSPKMIHFETSDITDDEFMGYICLNSEFKRCLLEFVKTIPQITVIDGVSYGKIDNSYSGCVVEIVKNTDLSGKQLIGSDNKLSFDLVIACDGKNSKARSNFFSTKIKKDYYQKAFTFTVTHERPHEGTAIEHFMNTGPFAVLPLRWPNRSSVVLCVAEDTVEAIANLSTKEFGYLIEDKFGDALGKVTIDKINADKESAVKTVQDYFTPFALTANIINNYVNKRVVLVGDSAHTIHPLAGQGLNQGIKDIQELHQLLSGFTTQQSMNDGIMELGTSASTVESKENTLSTLLNKYEKARKNDNRHMFEITDTINAVFSNNSQLIAKMRNIGFSIIERCPPFKKVLVKYAMGRRFNKSKQP